jgi:hypothetical protein
VALWSIGHILIPSPPCSTRIAAIALTVDRALGTSSLRRSSNLNGAFSSASNLTIGNRYVASVKALARLRYRLYFLD